MDTLSTINDWQLSLLVFPHNQSLVLWWYTSEHLHSVTKEVVSFLWNKVVVDRINDVLVLGVFEVAHSVLSFSYFSTFFSGEFNSFNWVVSFVVFTSLDDNYCFFTANDSCCKGCLDSEVNVVTRYDFGDYPCFRKSTQGRSCILLQFVDEGYNSRNRGVSEELLSICIQVLSHFFSPDFLVTKSDTSKSWKRQLFYEVFKTLEPEFRVIVDHFRTSFDINEMSSILSVLEHHRHRLKLRFVLIYFEYFECSSIYVYFPHNISTSAFVECRIDKVEEFQIDFITFDLSVNEFYWVTAGETVQNIGDLVDRVCSFSDCVLVLKMINLCYFHSVLSECSCFVETKSLQSSTFNCFLGLSTNNILFTQSNQTKSIC